MAVQQVAASTAGHSTTEQDRLKTRRLLRSHNLSYGKTGVSQRSKSGRAWGRSWRSQMGKKR
jgi:hypothetical protein